MAEQIQRTSPKVGRTAASGGKGTPTCIFRRCPRSLPFPTFPPTSPFRSTFTVVRNLCSLN